MKQNNNQTTTDSDTNNGQGFNILTPIPLTKLPNLATAHIVDNEIVIFKHLKFRPKITKAERNRLTEEYIRGKLSLDEFRLEIRKSRAQAYRIIRAFKDSDEYFNMCGDEWDKMTFSKEFNNSIPATVRYNNLTKVKCQLLSNKGSVIVDESKLKENEYRIIKALNAIHAELSP